MALIQGLAQRARPGATLGQIDARRADLSGRATSLWTYVYYFTETSGRFYDGWRAWADGHLEYIRGEPVTISVEVGDLSGSLDVDTDRGVVASLAAGAKPVSIGRRTRVGTTLFSIRTSSVKQRFDHFVHERRRKRKRYVPESGRWLGKSEVRLVSG